MSRILIKFWLFLVKLEVFGFVEWAFSWNSIPFHSHSIRFIGTFFINKILYLSQLFLQFYSLLERDPVANLTLSLRSCTLFVPTNAAFQRFHGSTNVLYHIGLYNIKSFIFTTTWTALQILHSNTFLTLHYIYLFISYCFCFGVE